jgi:sporulation protein YlmC with PRC-barrel domain
MASPKAPPGATARRVHAASQLIDGVLIDDDESLIGQIEELIIDIHSGRIASLIVESRDGDRMEFPWSWIDVRDGRFRLRPRTHS